jgi:hypothetical protein
MVSNLTQVYLMIVGFLPPLKDMPSRNTSKIKCNCITAKCNDLKQYNCTSAFGCFAMFKTRPQNTALYGCLEDLPPIPNGGIHNGGCEVKLYLRNTSKIQLVTKCCYENHCNEERLLEPYFPKERK